MTCNRLACLCLGFCLAVLFTSAPQNRPQAALPTIPATGAHTGP